MAVAAQVAGAPSQTESPPPAVPDFPARLWAAIERAIGRPTGLVTITGPGAEQTAAALHQRLGLPLMGVLADGPAVNAAVDAAERGLALATLDSGDAVGTILALRRLAGDRFAFAAALRLVIAQRVVPGLCAECRQPVQAFGSTAALLGMDPGAILWSAPGCERCGGSGQGGEVRVFEGVEVDAAMRRLIYDGADAPLLARHAFLAAPNLASAARTLARDGVIAAEQAVRVSRS